MVIIAIVVNLIERIFWSAPTIQNEVDTIDHLEEQIQQEEESHDLENKPEENGIFNIYDALVKPYRDRVFSVLRCEIEQCKYG